MDPEIERIELTFTRDAYEELEKLATSTNRPITTVLRDAVAFEKWYWDTLDKGERVLVERGKGSFREVRRPRGPALTSPPQEEIPGGTSEPPRPGGTPESPHSGGTPESPYSGGTSGSPQPGGTSGAPQPPEPSSTPEAGDRRRRLDGLDLPTLGDIVSGDFRLPEADPEAEPRRPAEER